MVMRNARGRRVKRTDGDGRVVFGPRASSVERVPAPAGRQRDPDKVRPDLPISRREKLSVTQNMRVCDAAYYATSQWDHVG